MRGLLQPIAQAGMSFNAANTCACAQENSMFPSPALGKMAMQRLRIAKSEPSRHSTAIVFGVQSHLRGKFSTPSHGHQPSRSVNHIYRKFAVETQVREDRLKR